MFTGKGVVGGKSIIKGQAERADEGGNIQIMETNVFAVDPVEGIVRG